MWTKFSAIWHHCSVVLWLQFFKQLLHSFSPTLASHPSIPVLRSPPILTPLPPHTLLTNKAVTVCICTCHISKDATQISNQHHMPDPVTFQYVSHTACTHTYTLTQSIPPHLTLTPPPSTPTYQRVALHSEVAHSHWECRSKPGQRKEDGHM